MNTKFFLIHPALKGWVKKNETKVNTQKRYMYSTKYLSSKIQPKRSYKPL